MLKLINHPDVRILHIEPTDFCNVACPQCARELDLSFDKKNISHLTVDQIRDAIGDDILANLDKMYMCGVYGDPAAGKHTLEILKYLRSINPNITLGMNTNGSLRDSDWWREVAGIINQQKDYVVFSLDGLGDTNHIYRVGANWGAIMKNVKTYIEHGGRAHWDMLVFDHNAHEVDQAQQLAKDMGFKWFRAKVSKRFLNHPISFLQPPKGWKNPVVVKGPIQCYSLTTSSIYLSARGILYPCGWLGANTEYDLTKFDSIRQSWQEKNPNPVCFRNCASNELGSSFTNQWQQEIEF